MQRINFRPLPLLRIAAIMLLVVSLGGWDTCTAFVGFKSCPGPISQAQIISLSPTSIPGDTNSMPLIVSGANFTPQSQILWNGSTIPTTFLDSRHLQAIITQEIFESFGGLVGESVRITVRSQGSGGGGCPPGGDSEVMALVIN